MHKPLLIALLLCSLLAGCSNTFIYNRLDWLIPWYVEGYVDLDRSQKRNLKAQLRPLLAWHRTEELQRYIALLDRVEADLTEELVAGNISGWVDEAVRAWERIEARMLPLALDLGGQLGDDQVEEFLASLDREQAKLEREYLDRDAEEYVEENLENFEDNLEDFLGRLEPSQRARLLRAARDMQRFDDLWLAERAAWVATLAEILRARAPGWEQAVLDAIEGRKKNQDPAYEAAYSHNQQVINNAIADVLNARTPRQSARLQREIAGLRSDLEKLASQAD